MAKIFVLVLFLVAIAVALLAINILLKKNGTFRSEDIGHSKAMRSRGIHCYQAQERIEHSDRSSIKDMMK